MYANQLLWVLLRCCHAKSFQRSLAIAPWLNLLLPLACDGEDDPAASHTTRILATRLWTSLLPHVSPSLAAVQYGGHAVATQLFRLISCRVLPRSVAADGEGEEQEGGREAYEIEEVAPALACPVCVESPRANCPGAHGPAHAPRTSRSAS